MSFRVNGKTALEEKIYNFSIQFKAIQASNEDKHLHLDNIYIPNGFLDKIKNNDSHFVDSSYLGHDNQFIYFYSIFTKSRKTYYKFYEIDYLNYEFSVYTYQDSYVNDYIRCPNDYSVSIVNGNTSIVPTSETDVNFNSNNCGIMPNYDEWYLFDYDTSELYNEYLQLHVGSSYLDDFMYSTKSSDIFIMGLYYFIPLLLFILAIKVLRKGLFK